MEKIVTPFVYRTEKIITVSQSSKKDVLGLIPNRVNDIEIINPGVINNLKTDIQKTKYPSFIYLGRLRPYKNIDDAIKAFSIVLKEIPDARLTIAGTGENEGDLKKLVHKLDLQNSVEFAGYVSNEIKYRLLSQSWMALQPSSFEGWGITVIEANSCATPVVASDVGGLRDSVLKNHTGVLVEPKNVNDFAKVMIFLSQNKKVLNQMSENALSWSKKYTWDKSSDKFEIVLSESIRKVSVIIPAIEPVSVSR
jgi:glycosyltransferase involved in cell wall biosynthesis